MKKITLLLMLPLLLGFATRATAQTVFDVKVSGKGKQTIIFLPGYTCSGEVWNETVKSFDKKYVCHVLTMPGFAGVKAQADPTLKKWVDTVAAYIKEQKLGKVAVVGHSLGGVMAMWLAIDYPDLVARIVVVDALPCYSALNNPAFESEETPECKMFVKMFKYSSDSAFRVQQTGSMKGLMADSSRREMAVNWAMRCDRTTLGLILCDFLNTDLRDRLDKISCPALVLLEPSFKEIESNINTQYSKLKGAQLNYAGKGLHFIMFDDTNWYLKQLHTFLP